MGERGIQQLRLTAIKVHSRKLGLAKKSLIAAEQGMGSIENKRFEIEHRFLAARKNQSERKELENERNELEIEGAAIKEVDLDAQED